MILDLVGSHNHILNGLGPNNGSISIFETEVKRIYSDNTVENKTEELKRIVEEIEKLKFENIIQLVSEAKRAAMILSSQGIYKNSPYINYLHVSLRPLNE